MPKLPDPELAIQEFWRNLRQLAEADGWMLTREMQGRSTRNFVLTRGATRVRFLVKLSQNSPGFWGITSQRAAELARGKEPVVLLTRATAGYFIPAARFATAARRFAHNASGDYRINEGTLKAEVRFNALDDLWTAIRPDS